MALWKSLVPPNGSVAVRMERGVESRRRTCNSAGKAPGSTSRRAPGSFAPAGKHKRDNALELQVRGLLADDLPIEKELGRWMALWGAPGL